MFQFTVFALPHILAASLLLALGAYSVRYRSVPVAVPFTLMVLFAGLWSTLYSLELCTVDYSLKVFWAQARFLGLSPLSGCWLVVGLHLSGHSHLLRGRRWLLLTIVPAAAVILSFTTSHLPVFRYDYHLVQSSGLAVLVFRNGPLFWCYVAYAWGMSVVTGVLLAVAFRGRSIIRKRQVALVILAIALFILVDALYQVGITPIRNYTLAPAALAVSAVLIAFAVFQYRILDLSPLAKSLVMDGIPDSILVFDEDGNLTECNRAASQTFGLDRRLSVGKPLATISPAFAPGGVAHGLEPGTIREVSLTVGEAARTFEVLVEPILYRGKHRVGSLFQWHDVTERKVMEQQIRALVIRDPLTGLYNRRYMDEMLDRGVALAVRTGMPLSFVMIDIDLFKTVNDTFGHLAGDEVLRALASLLLRGIRKSDVAYRYGGEEFLLVLYGTPLSQTLPLVESLRKSFEALTPVADHPEVHVTFSAGIAAYPTNGGTVQDLLRCSDDALYLAKRAGRNRVVTVSPHP